MRAARWVFAAGLVSLVLAGCTGSHTVTASSLVGETMAGAYRAIGYTPPQMPPGGLGVVTYNLTPRVSSDVVSGLPENDWVVVAACYRDEELPNSGGSRFQRVAIGAVPAKFGTDAVKAEAREGKFNTALSECPGTSDTFEVPED